MRSVAVTVAAADDDEFGVELIFEESEALFGSEPVDASTSKYQPSGPAGKVVYE